LKNCRKRIRISSEDVTAYLRRGVTLLLMGKDDDAEQDFLQILRPRPQDQLRLQLIIDEVKRRRAL